MNSPFSSRSPAIPQLRLAYLTRRLLLSSVLLSSLTGYAQSTSPSASAKASASAESDKKEDDVLVLSEFEVRTDSDKSYGALNSSSITRFNVEMDKMPISANIFTERFMKDVGATSVEALIQNYSAGAGFNSG